MKKLITILALPLLLLSCQNDWDRPISEKGSSDYLDDLCDDIVEKDCESLRRMYEGILKAGITTDGKKEVIDKLGKRYEEVTFRDALNYVRKIR